MNHARVEEISDKALFIFGTIALISIGACIDLFALQNMLTDRAAEPFNAWFQFIFGNWPKWEGVINRRSHWFSAVMVFKLLLIITPIYGIFATLGKLVALERSQLMRIIDLINLRDILLIDAVTDKLKIPEEQKETVEYQLRMAFEAANDELYNEQAPILLGLENARLLKERLDKDIFQNT